MSISLIRDRVKVQILRDTKAVARIGFGVPLFIGTTVKTARALSYKNLEEVGDVYAETDEEYIAALGFFGQSPQPRELIIGWKDTDETYTEALAAIRVVNDTFYAVTIESMLEADILAMSAAVSALPGFRMFCARSANVNILDQLVTNDIASQLKALSYDQARVVYHPDAVTNYAELRQLGRCLPIPESATTGPGSAAWHDQPIVGLTGGNFTSSQRSTLEAKNCEYFINVAGATRSMGGKMAGGEFADIVHFVAWLETRLAEDVYELMARAGNVRSKVPFSDEGIARVEGVVRNRLNIAVGIGGILNDYTISVPLREETQFGDRVNRTLKDVTFVANLQGAIKFVEISGTLVA